MFVRYVHTSLVYFLLFHALITSFDCVKLAASASSDTEPPTRSHTSPHCVHAQASAELRHHCWSSAAENLAMALMPPPPYARPSLLPPSASADPATPDLAQSPMCGVMPQRSIPLLPSDMQT